MSDSPPPREPSPEEDPTLDSIKEWSEMIVTDAAIGAAHGGFVTLMMGGLDLGVHALAGAAVGGVIGFLRYPFERIRKGR
jgi:hypothetical protein